MTLKLSAKNLYKVTKEEGDQDLFKAVAQAQLEQVIGVVMEACGKLKATGTAWNGGPVDMAEYFRHHARVSGGIVSLEDPEVTLVDPEYCPKCGALLQIGEIPNRRKGIPYLQCPKSIICGWVEEGFGVEE